MINKQEYLDNLKQKHAKELVRADKFIDLINLCPVGTQITYKGEEYLVVYTFPYWEFKIQPCRLSTNNGLQINLMDETFDLGERIVVGPRVNFMRND